MIRRTTPSLELIADRARSLADDAALRGTTLTWSDGPSAGALVDHLTAEFGPVRLVFRSYLGQPWSTGARGRALEVSAHRSLGPFALLLVAVRAWSSWGPIGSPGGPTHDLLVELAEDGGDYPLARAIAQEILRLGARPTTLEEATATIAELGYERLWSKAWSQLT